MLSKKEKIKIYDIRQMLSYLGWIDCTDTYGMYEKWIKPYVSFRYCKKRLSNYDRHIVNRWNYSKATVNSYIKQLEDIGLIVVNRVKNECNTYISNDR